MLCSNFHTHHCLLKDKKIKIKTFPYLPTQKLKNKSETDLFFLASALARAGLPLTQDIKIP